MDLVTVLWPSDIAKPPNRTENNSTWSDLLKILYFSHLVCRAREWRRPRKTRCSHRGSLGSTPPGACGRCDTPAAARGAWRRSGICCQSGNWREVWPSLLAMVSLLSPVSADHQSLHGGKVEGAQVGGKPRCPPLQVPARPVLFPSPDRDHYCVSYTNVILESEASLTFFFRESPRSRDPCWRPGSPWPASSCCPRSSAALCPGSD